MGHQPETLKAKPVTKTAHSCSPSTLHPAPSRVWTSHTTHLLYASRCSCEEEMDMLGWSDGSGSLGQAEVCVSHTGFHRMLDGDGVWWVTRRRPESRRCGTSAVPLTPGHKMPLTGPTCCLHRQVLCKATELAEPHSTHPGSLFGDMNGGLLGRKKEDCRQEHLLCQLEIKRKQLRTVCRTTASDPGSTPANCEQRKPKRTSPSPQNGL